MKYATILMLLFLSCIVVSCKPDGPVLKSYCEVNPGSCQSVLEAKKFFVFNIGSWWVYEEETSGERDSVYVTDYYNADNYDFDIRTHSTLEGYNYHYWVTYAYGSAACNTLSPVAGKCLSVNRNKAKLGDYIGEGKCFFVNYKTNDIVYSPNVYFENNKVIVEEIFETYPFGAWNFDKTIKMHELNTVIEGYQPTNHYYSENVGLIRKELLDSDEVWNLVDYHIEQ